MKFENIAIVGCGRLGSMVAYTLSLKTHDPDFNFKTIELIDPDLLIQSNYPYGILTKETFKLFLNYPKVYALESALIDVIEPTIELIAINHAFPHNINETTYYVDCRDSSKCSRLCKLKASCEGPYGRIILNPEDCEGVSINYTLFPSQFYTLQMATIICDFIFNNKIEDVKMKEIPINLLKGAKY